MSKDGTLEAAETARFEMLDHFNDGRSVESLEATVAIGERALQELDSGPLAWRHRVEVEPACGELEGAVRHVEADDEIDGGRLEQGSDEPSLAASEVEHALGASLGDGSDHCVQALLVETQRLLDRRLLLVMGLGDIVGIEQVVLLESRQGLPGQLAVVT